MGLELKNVLKVYKLKQKVLYLKLLVNDIV